MMAKKKATTENPALPEGSVPTEYTVVARRYRPQQFSELIGQEAVSKAITNAIQSDRVAHAYLFTGARGVGKTSAARILAKAMNCEQGPTVNPCNQCATCKAITAGEDIDVIEIDGASNNGVDEVRTIRQNVATRPSRSRYKIYIIDEVHMLSKPAFNALLKTLEEPPAHVKFIFATTEVDKIPITILSRCQRFDFPSISTARIVDHLRKVITSEKREVDDEALRLIARRAAGSMRDAQSLLEQMLSSGAGVLSAKAVHQILGTASNERVIEIASRIIEKKPGDALALVAQCSEDGLQLGEVLDQLIEYWRALMLLNSTEGEFTNLDLPEEHLPIIKEQASRLTLDTVLAGLDLLTTTKGRVKATSQSQVLVEMAVVRLSRMDDLIPLTQLAQWISQRGASKINAVTAGTSNGSGTDQSKKNGPLSLADKFRAGNPPAIPTNSEEQIQLQITDATLSDVWSKVRSKVGVMLSAELEKAGLPAILGPRMLVLRFPARYNLAYEFCKDSGKVAIVEESLKTWTGQPWTVRLELETRPDTTAPVAPSVSAKEKERMALSNPLLTAIVGKLEGRMLKMDEGFGYVEPSDDPEPEPEVIAPVEESP